MLKLSVLLLLFGSSIIVISPGRFDYEEYGEYDLVIEAVVHECDNDSLTAEVLHTWTGPVDLEGLIGLSNRDRIRLSPGDSVLLMVDSTGVLSSYGHIEEGYYRMAPRSSPDILSVDDLSLLASGYTPEFNKHESLITVHFPISGEAASITVSPVDEGRRTTSNISYWDAAVPEGTIVNQRTSATKLVLYPDEDALNLNNLVSFQGSVLRFERGTYFYDMWPLNPCLPSIDALEDYYLHDIVPTYVFRIETGDTDNWSIGLSDPAFLILDGSDFWITGRQLPVSHNPTWEDTLCFGAYFGGFPLSSRRTLLRLNLDNDDTGCPMIASILELAVQGDLTGELLYLESRNAEPVPYTDCRLSLLSPVFTLSTDVDSSLVPDFDGCNLSFTCAGRGVISCSGKEYYQTPRPAELHQSLNRSLSSITVAAFDYPLNGTGRLIFQFTNSVTFADGHSLIPRLVYGSLREDSLVGNVYLFEADSAETVNIGEFSMHLKQLLPFDSYAVQNR